MPRLALPPLRWWDELAAMVVTPFPSAGPGPAPSAVPPFYLQSKMADPLLLRYEGQLSRMSRRLNNLFAFSAIGTTGRFVPFHGLANVVLEGHVYHRLLDVADKDHSMHWFLYDE
ncbi:hypothetical protein ETB97_005221 [Aspergillus alliaceus]|uniref:Uncharacterized protein n=1 Tax=Petromyces alliaceus TaxID=209559 RepID=A0A8H5ZXZ3_PETAA|nr:hypothetical protein ETB97_005221 [Aspergillus burnettii]